MFRAAIPFVLFAAVASAQTEEKDFILARQIKRLADPKTPIAEFDKIGKYLCQTSLSNKMRRETITIGLHNAFLAHKANDDDTRCRACVIWSMRCVGHSGKYEDFHADLIPQVIKFAKQLKNRDSIDLLGNIGPRAKDALPVLTALQDDSNDSVAFAAKRAVAKINGN